MSQRSNQVAEELRKIISTIFIEDMADPRLGFLTVTRIGMADDLRFARVYYSVLGNEEQKKITAEAIQEHAKMIRHLVVERINMRYAMELKFMLDPSIEESFRLGEILKKIHKEEPEAPEVKEKKEPRAKKPKKTAGSKKIKKEKGIKE